MPISTTVTAFVLAAVALSVQAKQHCALLTSRAG